MAKKSTADLQTLRADGGLKELVLRWFTDTQAPLILRHGNFPDWFLGLTARKEAEEVLRDKAPGNFLIRLSDKAIGYILSYKGHDRCRHFVISQNPYGQFVIAGDCQLFKSLTELIEHYKVSPIQPFGEFLVSGGSEDDADDLYDVVNAKMTSGVSVQALRSMWDQGDDGKIEKTQPQQYKPPPALVPSLPPKSRNRKLKGTVSVDATSLSQAIPPVPKRGLPLGFSLSSLPDTTSRPNEAQTDPDREQERRRRNPASAPNRSSFHPTESNGSGHFYKDTTLHAELNQVETRSQSLPYLGNSNEQHNEEEEEEKNSNNCNSFSFTPSDSVSTPPNKLTVQTYSLHAPDQGQRSSRSELEAGGPEEQRSNPLYQTTDGGQGDATYAEVPHGQTEKIDDTYEQIQGDGAVQGNTYESLEDLKNSKPKSTWGKNNINWKKFLPDYKKK